MQISFLFYCIFITIVNILCVVAVLDVIEAWNVAAKYVDFFGEISCIIKIPPYEMRERIWISIS